MNFTDAVLLVGLLAVAGEWRLYLVAAFIVALAVDAHLAAPREAEQPPGVAR